MAHRKPALSSGATAALDAPEGHLCVDDDSSSSFVVAPGQAILDAAIAQDVPLPYGCHVGTCGTCAVAVLRGAENLDAPDYLEAEALKRFGMTGGERLACRATTRGPLRVRPLG